MLAPEEPVFAASKVKESMAGMLAQAKLMASRHFGTELFRFNLRMVDFGDLWPLLEGKTRTEESPGSIRLEFVGPDGSIRPLRFEAGGCLISDADISNFNRYMTGQSRPTERSEDLVAETMNLLDDQDCWNKVRTIAIALANDGHGRYRRR